jgi:hypothetical protein
MSQNFRGSHKTRRERGHAFGPDRPASSLRIFLVIVVALVALVGDAPQSRSNDRATDPGVGPSTIELVSYQAPAYRYLVVPSGAPVPVGFEQVSFNDSGFSSGSTPMGSGGNCPLQSAVQTAYPVNADLLVRRTITVPAGTGALRVMFAVDNDVLSVFWNGVMVANQVIHDNCPIQDEFRVNVPANLVLAGANLLALHVRDRGDESFIDLRVLAECNAGAGACGTINSAGANHNVTSVDVARALTTGISAQGGRSPLGSVSEGLYQRLGDVPQGLTACTGSYVDNLRWSHVQESVDYMTMVAPAISGCASCGASMAGGSSMSMMGGGPGRLPTLEIQRYLEVARTARWRRPPDVRPAGGPARGAA